MTHSWEHFLLSYAVTHQINLSCRHTVSSNAWECPAGRADLRHPGRSPSSCLCKPGLSPDSLHCRQQSAFDLKSHPQAASPRNKDKLVPQTYYNSCRGEACWQLCVPDNDLPVQVASVLQLRTLPCFGPTTCEGGDCQTRQETWPENSFRNGNRQGDPHPGCPVSQG